MTRYVLCVTFLFPLLRLFSYFSLFYFCISSFLTISHGTLPSFEVSILRSTIAHYSPITSLRLIGEYACTLTSSEFVTYRAGRDISRLMEMVRRAGFPFEALALGLPTRDGPVTRAAGDPALPF